MTDQESEPRTADSAEAREHAVEALRFARERLGPASEQLFSDPAAQVPVLARLRAGYVLEDAVLAEAHRAAAQSPAVADEFIAYFLRDLLRAGHRVQRSAMRRFLDTDDLVQSMLGDVWPELCDVRFETRGRFLAYLSQRLGWKAFDRSRAMQSRPEGKRAEVELDDEPHMTASPADEVAESEEREQLALAILRLPARDRQLITLYLRGRSHAEIAAELDLSYEAARVALRRAIHRARRTQ
ncbi:MAG: sigma-70 family RNA polymerase sigma factor [Planctomycetota bacterium]